jgi:hypothetical protein
LPSGKDAVLIVGADTIVIVRAFVPFPPRLSAILKVVAAELTAADGVPEITPAELRDRPDGKVPVWTERV